MATRYKVGSQGQLAVGDSTPVRLLAQEIGRASLLLQVIPGGDGVWIYSRDAGGSGDPDASTVRSNGLWLDPSADATHAGGSYAPANPHAGEVWAICAVGGSSTVSYFSTVKDG